MRGILITFEGCEGSGKTTQADKLADKLRSNNVRVLRAREPGGTKTGEIIREILQHNKSNEHIYPEAETLLFVASRAQLVRQVILPSLKAGEVIICDRYIDSTVAYQGYGRGQDIRGIQTMNGFAVCEAVPDMTFLLDITIQAGFERLHKRNAVMGTQPDRMEQEDKSFHERVRNGYLEIARQEAKRFCIIDAMKQEAEIADTIWAEVTGLLSKLGK